MDSIGSSIGRELYEARIDGIVEEAIGPDTYTDFGENARILKLDGKMHLEAQKDMTERDGVMVSSGHETEYVVRPRDEEPVMEETSLDDVIADAESRSSALSGRTGMERKKDDPEL